MSDPAKYRSREEVQEVRAKNDPIERQADKMLQQNIYEEQDLKKINQEIRDIVNEAVEFAKSEPEPEPAELYRDVLVEGSIAP